MSEDDYNNWLEAAELDREAVESLISGGQFNLAVFHCQQTIEKRLKALIAWSGKPQFTHSLIALLEEIEIRLKEKAPEEIIEAMRNLDLHYSISRYPGQGSLKKLYSKKMAADAKIWMEQCLSYIESLHLI